MILSSLSSFPGKIILLKLFCHILFIFLREYYTFTISDNHVVYFLDTIRISCIVNCFRILLYAHVKYVTKDITRKTFVTRIWNDWIILVEFAVLFISISYRRFYYKTRTDTKSNIPSLPSFSLIIQRKKKHWPRHYVYRITTAVIVRLTPVN